MLSTGPTVGPPSLRGQNLFQTKRFGARWCQTIPSSEVDDDSPLMGTVTFRAAQRKLNKSGVLCPFPIRQLEDIQKTHEVEVGVLEMNRAKGADDFEAVWDFVSNMLGL